MKAAMQKPPTTLRTNMDRRVLIEVAEPAPDVGRRRGLPEEPVEALGPRAGVRWDESGAPALGLGDVFEDVAGLEDAERRVEAAVHQHGDLAVGVRRHKLAAELLQVEDVHVPGVVVKRAVLLRELLEQDRHLLAVGRPEGMELQGVLSHGQLFVKARPGGGSIHGSHCTAQLLGGPHFRRLLGELSVVLGWVDTRVGVYFIRRNLTE